MRRRWTEEELFYLSESWGHVSVPRIAENLGRTENAVIIKANRLNFCDFLSCGDYISFNQLVLAVLGRVSDSYQRISWFLNKGFPVRMKKVRNSSFKIVYLEEFWKWAEENRSFVDFSRFEEGVLGEEPPWVKQQRKFDIETKFLATARLWTETDDQRLLSCLEKGIYTSGELSRILARSCGAIRKRIIYLNTPLRPVKNKARKYTEDEIKFITDGIKNGMSYIIMANRLMRSDKAIRGLVYDKYLTEDLDKVRKMIGNGKFYDGVPVPTVKQGVCLSRYRAGVKKELSYLAGILRKRANDLGYDPYWQRFMCKNWDDFKGCGKGQADCDSCTQFERIKEQYCARCGSTFFERKENRFCEKCRTARKNKAGKKWRREHGK